ncbi:DUF1080 domain-containing protein [Lacihabitans sp. LS3-19]|uniref:3-keto-disaccharide hydrolase n=1 Tax=Lacihabitans sp. LS3-19 TaxID=2487335 RepID=UPI0020CD656A|nr:DUF1080 domain-containing protein [Lacihabitans sp. LS3-19]MCP9767197.1 DUF1080 domain-containing protein [Lacihabitans sp. LS3-19]
MKTLSIFLLSISFAFSQAPKKDWIKLFNNKNLDGWDIKIAGQDVNDNYKNTFRVENKMIRVVYDDYKTFDNKYGHLYYHTPYSYFILDYDYRFTGNQTPGGASWNVRNSGVMFHSQSAQSLSYNQGFPVSLEMQLLGGLGNGVRHTANLCTPGTYVFMNEKQRMEHCIDSDSKTYDGDQWIKARLIVYGDSMVHQIIEGDTVLSYQNSKIGEIGKSFDFKSVGFTDEDVKYWMGRTGEALKEGYISLQAESHPIDFKNIKLLNLKGCMDPKAKNYKDYYVAPDNQSCKY